MMTKNKQGVHPQEFLHYPQVVRRPAYLFNKGNKENKLEQDIAACSMYFDTEKANIILPQIRTARCKSSWSSQTIIKANGTKFTANAFITAGVTQQYNLDEDKYIKIR